MKPDMQLNRLDKIYVLPILDQIYGLFSFFKHYRLTTCNDSHEGKKFHVQFTKIKDHIICFDINYLHLSATQVLGIPFRMTSRASGCSPWICDVQLHRMQKEKVDTAGDWPLPQ